MLKTDCQQHAMGLASSTIVPFIIFSFLLCLPRSSAANGFNTEAFIDSVISNRTHLKGAMVLLDQDVFSIARIKSELSKLKNDYGANHVRLLMFPRSGLKPTEEAHFSKHDGNEPMFLSFPNWWKHTGNILKTRWLPIFEKLDLPVVLMLASDESYYMFGQPTSTGWSNELLRDKFIDYVVSKADFFLDSNIIIGFDILNEPIPPDSSPKNGVWRRPTRVTPKPNRDILVNLYSTIIRRMRAKGNNRILVVQPGPSGSPQGFSYFTGTPFDDRVIYSFHHHFPWEFAAFGLHKKLPDILTQKAPDYPLPLFTRSLIKKYEPYSKSHHVGIDAIESYFEPARSFQDDMYQRYGKRPLIWIGEIGTTRFGKIPDQIRWYTDSFKLINKFNWGWAYYVYAPGPILIHDASTYYGNEGDDIDANNYYNYITNRTLTSFTRMSTPLRPSFMRIISEFKLQK